MKNRVMKFAQIIGNNRYLIALRDSFLYASALTIVAGFVLLASAVLFDPSSGGIIWGDSGLNLGGLIYGGTQAFNDSGLYSVLLKIQEILNLVLLGTTSVYSIMIVVAFTRSLNIIFFPNNKEDDVMVTLYSLGAFFISVPWFFQTVVEGLEGPVSINSIDTVYLGTQGIFTAIITTTITVFLYNFIVKKGFSIKLPKGVPSAVEKSFSSMIPGVITLMTFVIIRTVLESLTPIFNNVLSSFSDDLTVEVLTLPTLVVTTLQAPLLAISQEWYFSIFLLVGIWGTFWFGIHGFAVFGPLVNTTWSVLGLENIAGTASYIVTDLFYNYAVVTAGAVTLAPIIAIFIFGKNAGVRKIAKFGLIPALFGISEPILYGIPIVLNPVFFIPLVLAPVVQFFIAYLATVLGIIPVVTNLVPWTVPIFFSGLLYTESFVGAIFQLVLLAVGVLIWVPFVIINDRVLSAKVDSDENS